MTVAAPIEPASLLDIALRRTVREPATPFLLTLADDDAATTRVLTYGDALARAGGLAARLAEAGIGRGDRVGCYLSNSPSWVIASLAAWLRGACVAAVGTLMPTTEATGLFELAQARAVIALTGAPELSGDWPVIGIDESGLLPGPSTVEPFDPAGAALPDPHDLAVAIFTSGTTGRPKGITHSHLDIVMSAKSVAAGYARDPDFRPDPAPAHLSPGAHFSPFGHMNGYSRVAFRMWIGRPTLLVPRFSVAAAKAAVERFGMDTLQLSPAMIHMLATTEDEVDLSGLKYVTSGTAPLSFATLERFEARYGVPVMQAYGMSEVGAVSQERYDDVVASRRGPGSVGRLAAGVEVEVRPTDDDRPAGEGEIFVRTEETTKEFMGGVPVPIDDEGWFATGDVGRFDDGILYITGRTQEKLIVGGFNVYPAEVEDAARRSPLVLDAVVVGLDDDRLGERPVAGVVWAGAPDEAALLAELRAELAPYKVPRALFPLEAVPLTPRDKVDRRRATSLARSALESSEPG